MKRPAPSGYIQLRKGSGSGGQCTTNTAIILKCVWLIAAGGLLLVSISMYMNILHPMNDDNPTMQQQKIQTEEEADRRVAAKQSTDQTKEVINDVDAITNDQNNTQSSTSLSSDEMLLLQWLRTHHMSASSTASTTTFSQLLSSPIYFAPGSLPITQLSTLQQCYTNTTIYRDHFKESPTRRIPYSKKYELAYILLPKSGSSTGRFMMQHEFDAIEQRITISPALQNVITFVREPLSRFYSQYDEAYVRTAPWQKGQNVYHIDSTGTNKKATTVKHPFPYLHENLSSYHDYEDAFCPPTKRKHRRDCIYAQSQENGTLASRLERFVQDYNGRNIFDIHLALQVPLLSNVNDGRSLYITELHNTSNSESDWNTIAQRYIGEETILQNAKKNIKGDTKESGGVIQGRSYPRRFNKTLVSDLTERRICELVLLDYCCLNFPLPSVCSPSSSGGSDGSGNNLSCMMDYDNVHGRVRIQPSIFPEKKSK